MFAGNSGGQQLGDLLGGTGGGFAENDEEFENICSKGLEYSMITEILIEESILGWKEYELEVMRDNKDNVVIGCSIENIDAMGVHTGDSITVAPAQTLTDREYQMMRDASLAIILIRWLKFSHPPHLFSACRWKHLSAYDSSRMQ